MNKKVLKHKIKCRICNKSFKYLTSQHVKRHNLSLKLYFNKFPEEKIKNVNPMSFRRGKNSPRYGTHLSRKTKDKISKANSGNQHGFKKGEENINYKFGEENSFFGKKHSLKTLNNMRKIKLGENNPNFVDGYCVERLQSISRNLDFIPINEKTDEANSYHHIDKKFVMFLPRELHKSIPHSVKRNKNMELINNIAFEYLFECYFENKPWKYLLRRAKNIR